MTTEYLLPCRCGTSHRVSVSQSGETLPCICGAALDVPPLREMKRLEPAPAASAAPVRSNWGLRQRFVLAGLLLMTLSLAASAFLYFVEMPVVPEVATTQAEIDKLKPVDAWQFWQVVRKGMPNAGPGNVAQIVRRAETVGTAVRWTLIAAAVGLAIAAAGLLVPKRVATA